MGKFYEVFYFDAVFCQRILNIRWMGHDAKPHIGFPESSLSFHAQKIVDEGLDVSVVEQTETPKELLLRNNKLDGPKEKAVHREICEVFTAGTLNRPEMLSDASRFLAVFKIVLNGDNDIILRAIATDVSRSRIVIDYVTCKALDVKKNINLLISALSVEECVFHSITPPNDILSDIIDYVKHSMKKSTRIYIGELPYSDNVSNIKADINVDSSSLDQYPFGALYKVLADSFIMESIVTSSIVENANIWNLNIKSGASGFQLPPFVLNQLEIFGSANNDTSSLYKFLNITATPMGSRSLKDILRLLLTDSDSIKQRQNLVSGFIDVLTDNPSLEKNIFLKTKLNDLERAIATFLQTGSSTKRKAVYFDAHPGNTLGKLYDIVADIRIHCTMFENVLGKLMKNQVKLYEEYLLLKEDLEPVLDSLSNLVVRRKIDMAGSQVGLNACDTWVPAPGICEEFDEANAKTLAVKEELDSSLQSLSWELEVPLSYVHVKFKYEVSMSISDAKKTKVQKYVREDQLTATSQNKACVRYRPDFIAELADRYEIVTQQLSDSIYPSLSHIAKRVYEHKDLLDRFIRFLSFFDVCYAFGRRAVYLRDICNVSVCLPTIEEDDIGVHVSAESLSHPVGAHQASLKNQKFIPNDIELLPSMRHIVLSGPNMGGKSTMLRSLGCAVLMAQIGSFVCAKKFSICPFDALFTRIGARDSLLEHKSTLMIELEETSYFLHCHAPKILGLIDELGRGTSTFDGTAIAQATLEYISEQPSFASVFSTHYESVTEEAENMNGVANYRMKTEIANDNIKLTYKLESGRSTDSQGLLVAEMAGIPSDLITIARSRSRRF